MSMKRKSTKSGVQQGPQGLSSTEVLVPSSHQDESPNEPHLSVEQEDRSSVTPFSAGLSGAKATDQLNKSFVLEVYYGDQPHNVIHTGKSSQLLHGKMNDGSVVVVKKRPIAEIDAARKEKDIISTLEHPGIVSYKGFCEDKEFSYLVLRFVESTLEEYVKLIVSEESDEKRRNDRLKRLTTSVLEGLHFLHQRNLLHGDINRRNVLVDKHAQPKWIGMKWTETDCKGMEKKKEEEVKKALELIEYTLTGGESFWENTLESNLRNSKTLKKVLDHPVFWTTECRKLKYLEALGNHREATRTLKKADAIALNKTCVEWTTVMKERHADLFQQMGEMRPYSNDGSDLLRFIRNYIQHYRDGEKVDFLGLFPDLFDRVYILAEKLDWNSIPSVSIILSDW